MRAGLARAGLAALAAAALVAALSSSAASGASTSTTTIPPGTAAQVAALVAKSTSITSLPGDLTPSLEAAPDDTAASQYPQVRDGCITLTQCVFADTTSSRTLVLFGDSHAEMWLSAVIPYAASRHLRLVLLTTLGCPVADVTVWLSTSQGYYTACNANRAHDLQLIDALKPVDVVLAERTAHLKSSPTAYFTNAQWQAGLETTLASLKASHAKLVLLGDNTVMNADPPECLTVYPTNVKRCATPNPNPRPVNESHVTAERAAAKAEHVAFVPTLQWLCASSCSAVIGPMVAYFDPYHVTNTYAAYLSKVMGYALRLQLNPT